MKKTKFRHTTLTDNDVTDEKVYKNRRRLLKSMGYLGAGLLLTPPTQAWNLLGNKKKSPQSNTFQTHPLHYTAATGPSTQLTQTPYNKVTHYNNFYEFGTDKTDPAAKAQGLKVDPWTITIDGLVEQPITLSYDDLFKRFALEERIYRFRCVEAWSMVIPWIGFQLSQLLKQAKPLSSARYVAFETLYDPKQMPGQASRFVGGGLNYPYVEGLTIAEAMHPLTLLSVGLYGKTLMPQNGAPIRLVVPWKYGFKNIKSIVKIHLIDHQPPNTWNLLAPHEYGFYANVNPQVDHPRWSQKTERRITKGGLFATQRIDTQLFNGYDEVASLYTHLDLRKNF